MNMQVELFRIRVNRSVSKDDTLGSIRDLVEEYELNFDYDSYIEPELIWASENIFALKRKLDVNDIVPMGAYIRGLFGGEKRRGTTSYAGLVVEYFKKEGTQAFIKLYGTSKAYNIPVAIMDRLGVGIYNVYYRGLVNPFKCTTYRIVLSKDGASKLKEFLKLLIDFNKEIITVHDRNAIMNLISEVKATLDLFDPDKHYVIYRCARTPSACVPENLDNAVSESHIAYIECKSRKQAYYYAAILNYLAYSAVINGRRFIRDQFAKPLIAIVLSGLSWKTVPRDTRDKISDLSQKISKRIEWQEYSRQSSALRELYNDTRNNEFREIVETLDKYIINNDLEEKFNEALNLISTFNE